MKKYIIERPFPGAGKLSETELQQIAQASCITINLMGKPYHWLETYITEDKMFCVHIAENENVVSEHSAKAGFPVDIIYEVKTIIDPSTGTKP